MSDSRKKSGWAFWAIAGLVAIAFYPIAYGPAYWAVSTGCFPDWAAQLIMLPFAPLLLLASACDPVMGFIQWYLGLWIGMTIFIPTLAVAFAAFCVWLMVRIVNRRERWAKWTLAAVAATLFVAYPLSMGPVQWLIYRKDASLSSVLLFGHFYQPLGLCCQQLPEPAQNVVVKYLAFWMPDEPFEYHGP